MWATKLNLAHLLLDNSDQLYLQVHTSFSREINVSIMVTLFISTESVWTEIVNSDVKLLDIWNNSPCWANRQITVFFKGYAKNEYPLSKSVHYGHTITAF